VSPAGRLPLVATAGLALALAGCGDSHIASTPLGRPLSPPTTVPAAQSSRPFVAAPAGDPPHERGGHIAPAVAAAQDRAAPAGLAPSPTGVLTGYALAYTNWQASQLAARERQLAALSVGFARLSVEQTAAAESGAAALAAHDVANVGQVVALAPGEGPDRGQWVVVTEEQTTGTGPYTGLPAGPHVTLARVVHLADGWAVSAWDPVS
jgi:hypothetical protein